MDVATLTSTFAHLSLEWIALCIVALVGAFDGYTSGGSRVASAALALLLAVTLAPAFAQTIFLSSIPDSIPYFGALVVGVLFVALYLLVHRMTDGYGFGSASIVSALLAGFGFAVVVATVWIASPTLSAVWAFSMSVHAIFGESVRLYWTLAGLAALAFARG